MSVCLKCPVVRGVALATADDDDGSVDSNGSVTDSGRGASEEGDSATTTPSSSSATTTSSVATAATVAAVTTSRPCTQPCQHESVGTISACHFQVTDCTRPL